jgi:hypothetical protein
MKKILIVLACSLSSCSVSTGTCLAITSGHFGWPLITGDLLLTVRVGSLFGSVCGALVGIISLAIPSWRKGLLRTVVLACSVTMFIAFFGWFIFVGSHIE